MVPPSRPSALTAAAVSVTTATALSREALTARRAYGGVIAGGLQPSRRTTSTERAHRTRTTCVRDIACEMSLGTLDSPSAPYSRAPGPSRGCCRLVAARLALLDEEVRAPILRPARLIVVRALRPLLSVTDDRDTPSGDTLGHEVVHRRLRATLPQCQVVFIGSPLVTVPLDQEKVLLVGLEPTCILIEEVRVCRTDRVLVEVEVDVREVAHGDKITRSRPAPRRRRRPRLTGRTRSPRVGGRLSRSRI